MEQQQIELLRAKVDSLEKAQFDLLRYAEQIQANVKDSEDTLQILSFLVIFALASLISLAFYVALK